MNPVVIQHLGDIRPPSGRDWVLTRHAWDWCITGHNVDGAAGIALGMDGSERADRGTSLSMISAGVSLRRRVI